MLILNILLEFLYHVTFFVIQEIICMYDAILCNGKSVNYTDIHNFTTGLHIIDSISIFDADSKSSFNFFRRSQFFEILVKNLLCVYYNI